MFLREPSACSGKNKALIMVVQYWVIDWGVTMMTSRHGNIFHITGPWFNIKMSSHQYRKSHCGDKTVVRSSYLHNEISYAGKIASLYWIRALVLCEGNPLVTAPVVTPQRYKMLHQNWWESIPHVQCFKIMKSFYKSDIEITFGLYFNNFRRLQVFIWNKTIVLSAILHSGFPSSLGALKSTA